MVASVQANLLFQSLGMTREEILAKYPNVTEKDESIEDRSSQMIKEEPMIMMYPPQHQYQGMQEEAQV